MKLPDTTQVRLENHERAREGAEPNEGASFFVHLWAYGGAKQQLSSLTLDSEPDVAELVFNFLTEAHGQVTERWPKGLVARFDHPLFALSAAKQLQQRLLTFHRPGSPEQVVASILISGRKNHAGSADHAEVVATAQMLLDGKYAAQILVSEAIYELAQNARGFHFNSKPVRAAGDSGASETIYELLWTDESTYGHLREAGISTGVHTAGRYQIQSELGRGAMGVVYKAYDQVIARTVALKTISIDRNAPNRKELIERLKQEAKAAGGLDHPNIITIYDVGQEDDLVYLSMQFLEGKTLLTLLAEGDLPALPTLISYAEQICSAVGFAHARGVIHRDLKPANLMLTPQGVMKVLDFGIAKLDDAALTQTGLVVGTPMHMAPEQASDRKIDHRTDIFALGSVFYELFTREKPFKGDVTTVLYKIVHEDPVPPSVINPGLPSGIDAIIRKALAKEPRDRFQSCEEMGKAFQEQAASLTTTPPVTTSEKAVVVRPAPAPGPAPSSGSYLLETTTVRPRKSLRLPLTIVLLAAIGGTAGWAFYVKSQTRAFPAVVQKVIAVVRQELPNRSEKGTAAGPDASQQPAKPASSQSAADGSPAGLSAGSSATRAPSTGTQTQAANPETQQTQSATNNAATPTPPAVDTAPATRVNADASTGTQPPAIPAVSKDQDGTDVANEEGGAKATKKPAVREPAARVDGFSRRDVPELLRQADAAAGRSDYRLARYEYNLILKLDHGNAAARAGLLNVQAAEKR